MSVIEELEQSVDKWRLICRSIQGFDKGAENCPLCRSYFDKECVGCPIAERIGYKHCVGTPYELWIKHHAKSHHNTEGTYRICRPCEGCEKELDCDGIAIESMDIGHHICRRDGIAHHECENYFVDWKNVIEEYGSEIRDGTYYERQHHQEYRCRKCETIAEQMMQFLETMLWSKKNEEAIRKKEEMI